MASSSNVDSSNSPPTQPENETVIPLFAEEASGAKQEIITGRVRVSKVTHEHEQVIEELLQREEVHVERKPFGTPVDVAPVVREEGETIIIPVLEEVIVIERKLMLKEEIHIKRVRGTERFTEQVTLRKQEAVIERLRTETAEAGSGSSD